MDEQTTEESKRQEKVYLKNLVKIGSICQDLDDPGARAVLIYGGRAYIIDINLLTNRLLKFNTETLTDVEFGEY